MNLNNLVYLSLDLKYDIEIKSFFSAIYFFHHKSIKSHVFYDFLLIIGYKLTSSKLYSMKLYRHNEIGMEGA